MSCIRAVFRLGREIPTVEVKLDNEVYSTDVTTGTVTTNLAVDLCVILNFKGNVLPRAGDIAIDHTLIHHNHLCIWPITHCYSTRDACIAPKDEFLLGIS